MDPALLKEREAFKKKALANPVLENRKRKDTHSPDVAKKKSRKDIPTSSSSSAPKPKHEPLNYKLVSTASKHENFLALRKIVDKMKERFKEGDGEALSLDDLLDETNQTTLSERHKEWLLRDALPNNEKVLVTDEGKFAFKPKFRKLKDSKSLLRLLDEYDRSGKGGILLDEIEESLPNADKYLKKLGDSILIIVGENKRKVVFYNDKSLLPNKIDEEFQKLWRSVAVDGLDEAKIEEYLEKQGLSTMQDLNARKVIPMQKRKKVSSKKGKNFKKTNNHISNLLQDYSDKP